MIREQLSLVLFFFKSRIASKLSFKDNECPKFFLLRILTEIITVRSFQTIIIIVLRLHQNVSVQSSHSN